MIKKDSYVEIMQIVLEVGERAENIPEETKITPLNLWAKGFLLEDCELNKSCKIQTISGRVLEGILCEVNPAYEHGFGAFVSELMYIGPQAKKILWGENNE